MRGVDSAVGGAEIVSAGTDSASTVLDALAGKGNRRCPFGSNGNALSHFNLDCLTQNQPPTKHASE